MNLEKLIEVALGEREADTVLQGGQVVNVLSGEIYSANVAICGNRIAGIGNYQAKNIIDVRGQFICPGFMDGHVHIESSMVLVPEYAKTVVPLGTTTVVIDPHEIANVMGSEGIMFMLKSSKYNPLNVFVMLPSCVPATELETAGSELKAIDLYPFLSDKWVLGLGEVMNYSGVLERNEDILDKIKIVGNKRIDGHAPGVGGRALSAYAAAGIESDHESTTIEEARERVRSGMWLMIREGSTTHNLKDLLPLVTPNNVDRCFFVTDDRHPKDLMEEGHINYMVKTAITEGIDPLLAIRMATINTARYYQLNRLGAVAPGYKADLAIVENWKSCRVTKVFKNGQLVADDGQALFEAPPNRKVALRSSVNVKWLKPSDFQIPALGAVANVIGLVPHQATTKHLREKVKVEDGFVVPDLDRDVLKVAVVERHNASGNIGLGLVTGFGLKRGALASSVAHDSHNIIVVGTNDQDIFEAAVQIVRMRGGLTAVAEGVVIDSLPLPIAGLMSDLTMLEVKQKLDLLHKIASDLGTTVDDPFMALSFLSLSVIPSLKLTDMGLVDVNKLAIIDLFTE